MRRIKLPTAASRLDYTEKTKMGRKKTKRRNAVNASKPNRTKPKSKIHYWNGKWEMVECSNLNMVGIEQKRIKRKINRAKMRKRERKTENERRIQTTNKNTKMMVMAIHWRNSNRIKWIHFHSPSAKPNGAIMDTSSLCLFNARCNITTCWIWTQNIEARKV